MNRLAYPRYKSAPYVIVMLSFAMYVATFIYFYDRVGLAVASLALIPVMGGSWYFGIGGGLLTAGLVILTNVLILASDGNSRDLFAPSAGDLVSSFSMLITALVVGRMATIARERRAALIKIEQIEKERELHTGFLEKLNGITAKALEVDSLQSTLELLTGQIGRLFDVDDIFFNLWDKTLELPIPTAAYGSMSDIYPYIQYEPGEITPTTSAMRAGHPIAIENVDDSSYISQKVAALFPSRSMLAIPLITTRHKLGAILLGYNSRRTFDETTLFHAGIVAEQVALVLSKSLLLEEERKQVRQLSALHDIAITSIEADNEDELIERVTEIIGNNLFPDNFGVMLLDEGENVLRPHPSYRFYNTENVELQKIPLGQGITGQSAITGQPQRVGNVRRAPQYIDIDDRTISELCVPIKFKEQVLGVINAERTKRDAFSADDERLLVTLAGQLATAMEQLRRAQAERKWLDQLAHSNDLIYSIAQITTQIERSLSTDEIVQALGKELEGIGLTCIMAIYDKKQDTFTINFTSLSPQFLEIVEVGLGYPLLNFSFPRPRLSSMPRVEDMLRPAVIHQPTKEIKALFKRINPRGISAILQKIGVTEGVKPVRLPLAFEENLLGMLWVWGKSIIPSDLPILSLFAKQVGISLERARLFQEVQSLALSDPLTCLQNRRSVLELGRIEFARAQRMERPFCCMMIDIDHFKNINDRYGHQAGDLVLQEFAKRCLEAVREVDLVGRYGGEEFIILLPETDRDTAVHVAERLRLTIADNPIQISDAEISVTVSIGVATKDENTTHLEALIARADQALYIAKHKGRNRVAISM